VLLRDAPVDVPALRAAVAAAMGRPRAE
jgi:hypothetical protein